MDELLGGMGRIIWSQLWQVTALIAGVWLVLRVIGRNRPHLACALWLVVLLKCVTPPLMSSPSGIFCWLQRAEPADDGSEMTAAADDYSPPATAEGDAVVVQVSHAAAPAPLPDLTVAVTRSTLPEGSPAPGSHRAWPWVSLLWLAALAWLIGVLIYAAFTTRRLLACWRKLRGARQIVDPALAELVESLRRRLGIRRRVRLLVTECSLGPAVVGLWRPVVILPAVIVLHRSAAQLEPLLAHELLHVRRGDLWIGLLQTLALALWWFHPLVRLASRLVTREAERCCDEETIAHLGCNPATYARSLLDVLALKQQLTPIPAFPGVRPVDVTSQRLERIMKLGQGCHKRTPWWCWLVMLAAAAAVLPGAALVVGAKEKPKPTLQDTKQYIRPDLPLPDDEAHGAPAELVTRHYDVADVLAALAKDPGEFDNEARLLLVQLVQSAASGPWQEDGDSPGRCVGWDDGKLLVRQTADGQQRIEEQLAVLREHGYAQIVVEVRLLSGPAAVLNAEGVDWRMIGGSSADEPMPREVPPRKPETLHGTTDSVVQRHVPAMLALVDEGQANELLRSTQAHPKSNVIQAPKVTVFNGQSARVEDSVQRPFVIGVTPVLEADKTALKPKIKVISEGTSIRLRPVAQKDGAIRLDFGLTLSSIRDVETAEFPAGPGKEPITVQVPEVASTRLNTTVEMNGEQTLVLSVPKTGKGKKEQQPLCVLVSVRKVEGRSAANATTTTAEATRASGKPKIPDQGSWAHRSVKIFGWSLEFYSKEGGTRAVQQAGAGRPAADLHIRGGAKFAAAAEKQGNAKPDRIVAEADSVQFTSRPAAADAPARFEISLDGNVRMIHNDARIEAKQVLLHFDAAGEKPAAVRMQIRDARSLELPSKSYLPDDVQYFRPGPERATAKEVEKVYPVADLVIPLPTEPVVIAPDGEHVEQERRKQQQPDFETLVGVITATIEPKSWQRAGGNGTIGVTADALSLVIRQDGRIHEKVAQLLDQLRRLQDVQVVLTLQRIKLSRPDLERWSLRTGNEQLLEVAAQKNTLASLSPDVMQGLWETNNPTVLSRGPKITLFNGQPVNLPLNSADEKNSPWLANLGIRPAVGGDYRSIRLTVSSADTDRTTAVDVPRGHTLVVDLARHAWNDSERGVPILDKVPHTSRLFRKVAAPSPDTRELYLVTPEIVIASEVEDGPVLTPQEKPPARMPGNRY